MTGKFSNASFLLKHNSKLKHDMNNSKIYKPHLNLIKIFNFISIFYVYNSIIRETLNFKYLCKIIVLI